MTGFQQIAEELREFTALKYAGDCKCGKCQLVPRSVLDRTLATLSRLTASRPAPVDREAVSDLVFWYRNYKGEERYRHARPISIRFDATEWHHTPQWLMRAIDLEKNEEREFAMKDMRHILPQDTILSLFRPAKAWDSATSPGMTDLMISPESLDAVGEPVAWRVLITKNAKTYNEYTERLPFEPLEGSGVVVRREPEPLYIHPHAQPDTSAAVLAMRDACELIATTEKNQRLREINEASGPNARAMISAQAFTASKIAAAIRQLPTSERGDK